jgi:POT family proton-dependent oligopeptide transporter
MPTTTFWLIHVASAVVGLVAFVIFKFTIAKRMDNAQELAPA